MSQPTAEQLKPGTRVIVSMDDGTEQKGRVNYKRMAPPDFAKVAAVSVMLDRRLVDPKYEGSIFPPTALRLDVG